tara:strand:+ start:314 stop:550 length:237 start_codon:yes stop_codon:yes gene_type:complete
MFEKLNTVIEKRIKEVLQFHLKGTEEEFSTATTAVMSELTAMSDSLDGIMSEAQENAIFTTDGRKELAEQLTNVLIDN